MVCGTSDGTFGRERFFQTGKDNALFVAVDKLNFDIDVEHLPPHGPEKQRATHDSRTFMERLMESGQKNRSDYSSDKTLKGRFVICGCNVMTLMLWV